LKAPLDSEQRGLAGVSRFRIESPLIDYTLRCLREAGQRKLEAFVLWGGQFERDASVFRFNSAMFPEQTSVDTEDGLMVTISGHALHLANEFFYNRAEIMAGQVHSHPTDAFHSSLDDLLPCITILGGLSVVVPDFGANGWEDITNWAWFRLRGYRAWEPLSEGTGVEVF